MSYYIERETGAPGKGAYEYAYRPSIAGGLVVVEQWLPHAVAVLRAGEEGLVFSGEDAADWSAMIGPETRTRAAPAAADPDPAPVAPEVKARTRVEEHAASKTKEWRERFGLATEADRAATEPEARV